MTSEPNSARSGEDWFIDAAARSDIARERRSIYAENFQIGKDKAERVFQEAAERFNDRCERDAFSEISR